METESLKYPIGKFKAPATYNPEILNLYISEIEKLPENIEKAVSGLSENRLLATYRPGGWNIKQIVNHLADSHFNAFCRFKLALTEDTPVIKPYFEEKWAELTDGNAPIESSLMILKGLHLRWTILLKSLNEQQLNRGYYHPEHKREFKLKEVMGIYDWHCRHHLAHIELAKK